MNHEILIRSNHQTPRLNVSKQQPASILVVRDPMAVCPSNTMAMIWFKIAPWLCQGHIEGLWLTELKKLRDGPTTGLILNFELN